ncbi:MAG: penicillin acylase family protein [Saprospiraceae bacterium]|nr:penicillin acylase family protein [Saprospiraceae bacterium]
MWRLILSALVTVALIIALDSPHQIGQTALPALGKFLSPATGFWQNADRADSKNATLHLPGLTDEVVVVFDDRLVPHIFAQNNRDLYFAQGYVTAMHRLWQMDFSTRAAAGRISEIVGPRALQFDRRQRMLGLPLGAENALRSWQRFPDEFGLLEAYSDGVNAWIEQLSPRDYPLEYKLMGFEPEAWTPYKSALFTKSMAARLCLAEYDMEFTTLLDLLGPEQFAYLYPDFNPAQDPIIPPGTPWEFDPVPVPVAADTSAPGSGIGLRSGSDDEIKLGSNNWAVAGSKTASGRPILCSDPHLGLSLPSVWYEVQLNGPDANTYGVSLPGLPGIIIGFNEHIAWAMTNVGHDVTDWYRITWADAAQEFYMLDGQPVPTGHRIERYLIKGRPDVLDTVRMTLWGPVWEEPPYDGLAMRWLAHDESDGPELAVFTRLNRARDTEEFLAALDVFQTPAQNFAYADRAGNIALRIGGKLPLRSRGHGKFILDGAQSASGWPGFIPPRHNPVVINPERGFVSSANQKSTAEDYPYFYQGGRYFEDYRGRILNEKLAAMQGITVPEMQALQYDSESLKAREFLPHLLRQLPPDLNQEQRQVRDSLVAWDFRYRHTSESPVYWEIWFAVFFDLVWDEFKVLRDSLVIVPPESWRTIDLAIHEPGSSAFDLGSTNEKEEFADIARLSFRNAVDSIAALDQDRRRWGEYRTVTIRHLANIAPLNVVLRNAPGDGDALNATTSGSGPSWRMVVHMTDPVEAWVVYPGGQSGNPGSVHYDEMIQTWVQGDYYQVNFASTPQDVQAGHTYTLQPNGR